MAVDKDKLDRVVARARADRDAREAGYRHRALQLFAWVCGRCGREFNRANLRELTVHHRDHDHDNNPADGSNWELLCLFCHDNEHQRYVEGDTGARDDSGPTALHQPFAELGALLGKPDRS